MKTTLKQLKPKLNFIKSKRVTIIDKVLITENELRCANFYTEVCIKDTFGLSRGLHDLKTLDLVNSPDIENVKQYPLLDFTPIKSPSIIVSVADLTDLLKYASKDETRLSLNSIALDDKVLVAVDGYKLKYINVDTELEGTFLMPRDGIEVLIKIVKLFKDKSISIRFDDTYAMVETSKYAIKMRLVKRTFPKWRNIIPSKFSKTILINNWNFKEIKHLFDKAHYICTLENILGLVQLKIKGQDNFSQVVGQCDNDFTKIAFNASYLDIASKGDKSFEIKLNNELTPCLVNNAIVMPCNNRSDKDE